MTYFNAFWVGGLLCAIAQVLIDKTTLTPARILVLYVCLGVFLTAFGIYTPIVEYAGAGATVPIMGFGYSLCNGVKEAVMKQGFLGIFTGGVTATAAGITAAVLFGYLYALIFKPKEK
ncbi:MAG: stage V sporulation protein AE [Clostridia bacterium]|nr:stage V sporulation protein AE [Clostridia bacterium]